ncbi:MAG: hypothetical protein BWY79_00766 [Actinobacteria bacterium ADurb.Bin444]|nr:MAG: hypothetical protein BWY79_00766 [Actinobacteria bacterium ADurb.Bin444]
MNKAKMKDIGPLPPRMAASVAGGTAAKSRLITASTPKSSGNTLCSMDSARLTARRVLRRSANSDTSSAAPVMIQSTITPLSRPPRRPQAPGNPYAASSSNCGANAW